MFDLGSAREQQQVPGDAAGSLGLLQDVFRLVGVSLAVAASEQELRVTEDAGQRIVDLVGHARNQLAESHHALGACLLCFQQTLPGDFTKNLQPADAPSDGIQNRPGETFQYFSRRKGQLQFVPVGFRAAEVPEPARRQGFRPGEAVGQLGDDVVKTAELAQPRQVHPQHASQGRAGDAQFALAVEHQHTAGNRVEQGIEDQGSIESRSQHLRHLALHTQDQIAAERGHAEQ